MEPALILLIISIILCYVYAFVSGFTDAANAIATSIGTRAFTPTTAVLMAAVLEILGALTGTAVALTIGKGIVSLELISLHTVAAAILGAMSWSILTYLFGIPVSETHGLIGGIIGAAVAVGGTKVIILGGLTKVLIALIVSPLLGVLAGALVMGIIYSSFHSYSARKMTLISKNLQRLSAAFMAFSHGLNDAQKPMGVLVMALAVYYGWKSPSVPLWVILTVGVTAGLGVAYGGWRIIKTLGIRVTHLSPEQGFSAEFAGASILQLASVFGIPVSTTHTITSSIVGAGIARRISKVRWHITFDIIISWILTLPAVIVLGWLYAKLLSLIFLI